MIQGLWIALGIGTIVLLGAAMQQKNHKTCSDVKIEIIGSIKHMFIDEKDVLQILNQQQNVIGNQMTNIDIRSLEEMLEKNAWVLNAELFFDSKQVLNVRFSLQIVATCSYGSSIGFNQRRYWKHLFHCVSDKALQKPHSTWWFSLPARTNGRVVRNGIWTW